MGRVPDKDLVGVRFNKPGVRYSKRLAKEIARLYVEEGLSISKICERDGMPRRSTVIMWKREHKWFGDVMEHAKQMRAELAQEKAIEAAEAAIDKNDAPAQRLKFDAYRWEAEIANPEKFGKKVTHAGDPNNPISFVVSTGFPDLNDHQKQPTLGVGGVIEQKKSGDSSPQFKEEDHST